MTIWDYSDKKKEIIGRMVEERVNLNALSKSSRIDIEYKGYYYRCMNCGTVLASLNDDCGCENSHYDVHDLPERLKRRKVD